jgi:hypothetical protein
MDLLEKYGKKNLLGVMYFSKALVLKRFTIHIKKLAKISQCEVIKT